MRFLLVFLTLFIHWVIWSGLFDAFHLSLGIISCGLVTLMSGDLMFQRRDFKDLPKEAIRFVSYLVWLFYQIILSNIHIIKIVLSHDMYDKINPKVVKFKSSLKKESSLVTFANSITLTPGTVTIVIKDGVYYVHAIDEHVSADLPGEMEKRSGHVFLEN